MPADGALVVLPQPLRDALRVEEVAAGKLGGLICQVLAADRASRVLLGFFTDLAVAVGDVYLRQILNSVFACRWSATTSPLLLRQPEYMLENVFIACE